ncbi:hypothetical protein Z517_08901 [Fonsecaea pedrosoi CBS 271.37]|uniref:Uncharacterized protein n=1 Tax=Fonsecaea pedrosoi CBS 271.37 TaxID=1442368 RepID=A0A0D2DN12_9EURO|nr:uncharacterized protein Z517_08901 [Fonsecaea pedrosoi CBS 271.37]KIW79061.1 hypothetical protein Z517_08901 [Fonsecaea pedrosoi CBS 271.37]
MALTLDGIMTIVFGVFMAIMSLVSLWQAAHFAARGHRTRDPRVNSFELEA